MKQSRLDFVTVDVFTQNTFGGNPLAMFFSAEQLSSVNMQRIVAEMNYSETTFVLPPQDPENTASIRSFTPKSELPFAGHPNVGTGFVLAAHPAAAPVTGRIELVSQGGHSFWSMSIAALILILGRASSVLGCSIHYMAFPRIRPLAVRRGRWLVC